MSDATNPKNLFDEQPAGTVLPLGSVVLLHTDDATRPSPPVVVIGRGVLTERDGRTGLFDYAAVPYPQGLVDSNRVLFLNREDVARVLFVGYTDATEQRFEQDYDRLVAESGHQYLDT